MEHCNHIKVMIVRKSTKNDFLSDSENWFHYYIKFDQSTFHKITINQNYDSSKLFINDSNYIPM